MTGDQPRRVVRRGTNRWNMRGVQESVGRTDEKLAAIHGRQRGRVTVLPFRVELHTDGAGIEIVQKNLDLKEVLPIFLFHRGGSEAQGRPVLGELRLPMEQIRRPGALVRGALLKGQGSRQVMFLGVLADGAVGGKNRSQLGHALAHASNPAAQGFLGRHANRIPGQPPVRVVRKEPRLPTRPMPDHYRVHARHR